MTESSQIMNKLKDGKAEGVSFLAKFKVFMKVQPDIPQQFKGKIETIDISTWRHIN